VDQRLIQYLDDLYRLGREHDAGKQDRLLRRRARAGPSSLDARRAGRPSLRIDREADVHGAVVERRLHVEAGVLEHGQRGSVVRHRVGGE